MAKCSKCGLDVKGFASINAATNEGTCVPCASGKPVAAPAPAPVAAPAPAPKVAPKAAPSPAPVVAVPEPKVEKRSMVGKVSDAVKGAMTKIKKAVKKDDKKKKR